MSTSMFLRLCSRARRLRGARGCDRRAERRLVLAERAAGVRALVPRHLAWRSDADDLPAGVAALRSEVDDPVAGADHVEVVLDHDERVAGVDQAPERAQELRDVVEVQAGGRLVEEEERAFRAARRARRVREMAGELEPLRLAARERRHRLAEAQVLEPDVGERLEPGDHVGLAGEERHRFGHRQLEHVGDAAVAPLHLEHLGAEALAVAVGAAQVHVGQELHLDVLEAVAAAGGAAAVAGVEAERSRGVAALARERRGCGSRRTRRRSLPGSSAWSCRSASGRP
jgi:hypothetical protein